MGGAGGSTGAVFTVGEGGILPDACGGPDAESTDGSTRCETIDGGVTFHDVFSTVFSGCTGEICHGAPGSDFPIVGIRSTECCDGRVLGVPGNARESYLLDKVENHDICLGARMPFQQDALSSDDLLLVRRSICGGAPTK